jgi:hypothetical protein
VGDTLIIMDLIVPLQLREGDVVALRTGAPVPAYSWLQPGVEGCVIIADEANARDLSGEVTVIFARHAGHPIRLHRHWVRFISRPRGPRKRRS